MNRRPLVISLLLSAYSIASFGQEPDINRGEEIHLPDQLLSKLREKAASVTKQLDHQTERYLHKLSRKEARLRQTVAAKDSSLARELFDGVSSDFNNLQQAPAAVIKRANAYCGRLDSMTTSLEFLQKPGIVQLADKGSLQETLQKYKDLQSALNASEQAKRYILQRKVYLLSRLEQSGFAGKLKAYQKTVALYQHQLQEYKNLLDNPSQWENKLLALAQQLPSWKDFFARNSILGSLFALPVSDASPDAVLPAGLQTRTLVSQLLVSRFGSTEAVNQLLLQNIPAAQSQLQELKDRLGRTASGSFGNSDGSLDMPDYHVNPERSRSFWRRVDAGTSIQTQKASGLLPVTSDLGLTLGFRLSDKQTIGLGITEKIGFGSGWKHLRLSHQGTGLRSFLDIKLKGNFWMTGGYELNYRPGLSALDSIAGAHGDQVIKWQKSGLVGISKIVSLKSKMAKRTKVQLLWDFLSYSQRPRTQVFIWRVEYSFK